jgi:hypothetical protein
MKDSQAYSIIAFQCYGVACLATDNGTALIFGFISLVCLICFCIFRVLEAR